MRRSFTILAVTIVLLGLVGGAYFYYASRSPGVTISPTATLPLDGSSAPIPIEQPASTPAAPTPGRFTQVSKGPVVPGMVTLNIPAANASSSPDVALQYIERQSGNMYRYLVRAGTLTRISNRTVPGIQSAAWVPNGTLAFVRYLSGPDFGTVNTYGLPSDGSQGFFLAQNLSDISVGSTTVLTLTSGMNGSVGTITAADGSNARQVFATPLSQVRAHLAGSQYVVATKASSAVEGHAYLVSAGGQFSRLSGPRNGLAALPSPSGRWTLISYISGTAMQMELVNTASGEAISLPVATLAEKCAWTAREEALFCGVPVNPPSGQYPDDWYQGVAHFTDRIWKIDVVGRFAQLVLDLPKEDKGAFDVTGISLDRAVSVLSFVNKNDGSLWAYAL